MDILSGKEGIFTISIRFRFLIAQQREKGFWHPEGNVKFYKALEKSNQAIH